VKYSGKSDVRGKTSSSRDGFKENAVSRTQSEFRKSKKINWAFRGGVKCILYSSA
jgi:hypothetical protein